MEMSDVAEFENTNSYVPGALWHAQFPSGS